MANVGFQLGTPGKGEAQLKNCLHPVSLWTCQWDVFLIVNW